jgi:hypothetical protein
MNKIEKRLKKSSGMGENSLVIGSAFGHLDFIINIYSTVFVIDKNLPTVKAKNLVYREDLTNLNNLAEIGAIFFDLSSIDQLELVESVWQRNKSNIIIEGNDPIDRKFSTSLYKTGWRCTNTCGSFHIWEQSK